MKKGFVMGSAKRLKLLRSRLIARLQADNDLVGGVQYWRMRHGRVQVAIESSGRLTRWLDVPFLSTYLLRVRAEIYGRDRRSLF
ncbi:MAG: hypothetical protein ACHP7O_01235 [Burkholderiales bacterium]